MKQILWNFSWNGDFIGFSKNITMVLIKYISFHWAHQNCNIVINPSWSGSSLHTLVLPQNEWDLMEKQEIPDCLEVLRGTFYQMDMQGFLNTLRILSLFMGVSSTQVTWEPRHNDNMNCQWKSLLTINENHYNIKQVQTHLNLAFSSGMSTVMPKQTQNACRHTQLIIIEISM